MKNEKKTKKQLIEELENQQQSIVELERSKIQRTQVEDALWKSEERYRNILESIEEGLNAYIKF